MPNDVGTAYVDIKARLSKDFNHEINKGLDSTERRLSSLGTNLTKVGAITALAGLAGQAVQLTAAILPAVGAIGALPATTLVAGAAFGTLKTATAGMGDAMKAAASGDSKKLAEAMKGLAPAAREVVGVAGEVAKSWKKVQQAVAQKTFEGLKKPLQDLAKASLPTLQSGMERVGGAFNGLFKNLAAGMNTPLFRGALDNAFFTAKAAVDGLGAAMHPLMSALANLSNVGQQVLVRFLAFAIGGLQAKAAFYASAEGATQVRNALARAGDVFSQFYAISKNLIGVLLGIFRAGDSNTMLPNLVAITAQMNAWVNSAKGQESIKQIFTALGAIFSHFAAILPVIGGIIMGVVNAFNSMPGPVKEIALQMAAWAIVFGPALRGLAALSVGIKGLVTVVGGGAKAIGAAWNVVTGAAMKSAVVGARIRLMYVMDWIKMAATAVANGARMATAWVAQRVAAAGAAIQMAAIRAQIIASWVAMQAAAVANSIRMGIAWVIGFVQGSAMAVASMIRTAAVVAAQWLMMGLRSLAGAAMMAASWLLAFWPVILVIAIIIAIVVLVIKNWDTIKAATAAVWGAIVSFITAAWNWIKSIVLTVVGAIVGFIVWYWTLIFTIVSTVLTAVWNFIKLVWNGIMATIQFVIGFIVAIVTFYWNLILTVITTVLSFIWNVITTVWNAIWGTITAVLTWIWTTIQTAWHNIKTTISVALAIISSVISGAWEWIKGVVMGAAIAIYLFLMEKWTLIKGTITMYMDAIKEKISSAWNNIKETVRDAIDAVVNSVKGAGRAISAAADGMWEGLKSAFRSAINFIIRGWNRLSFSVPRIDVPGLPAFGGGSIGVPKISELAKGGTFKGMAIVGEKGPELMTSPSERRIHTNKDLMAAMASGGEKQPRPNVTYALSVETKKSERTIIEEFDHMERLAPPA